MNWKDDTSNLDNVAVALLQKIDSMTPLCCPSPSVHAYFYRHNARKNGSAWIWCSACGAFSHLDGLPLPDDWENCTEIEFGKLAAVPHYLEEKKAVVDTHLRQYIASNRKKSVRR